MTDPMVFSCNKAVLHTGDFRFCDDMAKISTLQTRAIHTLILDTTYCDPQVRSYVIEIACFKNLIIMIISIFFLAVKIRITPKV